MGRIFWQFIGILSLIGFVGAHFWWIVAAVAAVVAAVSLTRCTLRTAQAQAAELAAHNAELLERADQPARQNRYSERASSAGGVASSVVIATAALSKF